MNEKITLQDIINLFCAKHDMTKKDAELFVKTMFDLIEEALATEKYVKIKGFGTFKLTEVDARESVNVNTGERFEIQGHSKVTFTPDTTMKDLINKPFAHFETVVLNDGVELEDTPTEEEVIDAPETMEEAPVMVAEAPMVTEEAPIVVEETPAIVEEEPAIVEEETTIEEAAPEIAEEPVATEEPIIEATEEEEEVAIETPVAEEEVVVAPIVEEKPAITEPEPMVQETKADTKEKNINRILWGVIVVLVLIILFGAYWMFLRPSDTTEAPVVTPEAIEEVVPLMEDTIQEEKLIDSEMPVTMVPLELTPEELRKERVPALADTLEYVINGKEPISEHILQSGETIIRISVKHYGSKRFWPYIAKFNQDAISDPDNIPVGTVIRIPAILPKK